VGSNNKTILKQSPNISARASPQTLLCRIRSLFMRYLRLRSPAASPPCRSWSRARRPGRPSAEKTRRAVCSARLQSHPRANLLGLKTQFIRSVCICGRDKSYICDTIESHSDFQIRKNALQKLIKRDIRNRENPKVGRV
jgi:hypothetical protein